MTKDRLDKFWIGLIVGVLGALLGYFAFAAFWALYNDTSIVFFTREIFLGSGIFQDKIVTISILLDVVLFYFFLRANWYNLCKGILAVVICSVPVAVYLY
ncbi:MAG: hypothetical protein IT223_08260 [Crocinitomicaceae bacterium]|nr:hypothetical protein [Crocinitomicaceae bacterium]